MRQWLDRDPRLSNCGCKQGVAEAAVMQFDLFALDSAIFHRTKIYISKSQSSPTMMCLQLVRLNHTPWSKSCLNRKDKHACKVHTSVTTERSHPTLYPCLENDRPPSGPRGKPHLSRRASLHPDASESSNEAEKKSDHPQ